MMRIYKKNPVYIFKTIGYNDQSHYSRPPSYNQPDFYNVCGIDKKSVPVMCYQFLGIILCQSKKEYEDQAEDGNGRFWIGLFIDKGAQFVVLPFLSYLVTFSTLCHQISLQSTQ